MNAETMKKIKNMTLEELAQYKAFIAFFELLGVNEEDLMNAVALIKGYPELISKANTIIATQKALDDKILRVLHKPKDEGAPISALDDFNKEGAMLNPYGK